jgi:hypothetical protein
MEKSLLEKLIVVHLSKKSPPFIKPEGSQQQPATRLYTKPIQTLRPQ